MAALVDLRTVTLRDLATLMRDIATEVRGRAVPPYVAESLQHAARELDYYVVVTHPSRPHRP